MSNFLFGRIIRNDVAKTISSKIDFSMVRHCIDNGFGVHFIDTLPTKNTTKDINFQLSDNFLVNYCESFLKPIIYTIDGNPYLDSISKDLEKLHGLVEKILEFDFVEKIELRFSDIEVDEDEYEICETSIDEMKKTILSKYLSSDRFPVINVIVNIKTSKNN